MGREPSSGSKSREARFGPAAAFARADTPSTVISPWKNETDETSAEAVDVAVSPGAVLAPTEIAPVDTAEPSPGYWKPPRYEGSLGAVTIGVVPPAWPG